MELTVYDRNLIDQGIIDEYQELKVEKQTDKRGQLTLVVNVSENSTNLLQEDLILVKEDEPKRGYIIKHIEYLDKAATTYFIVAYSLNILLADRIVYKQQVFNGNVENVIKSFVNANAVNPVNKNRIIPNLVIAQNFGINLNVTESGNGQDLEEFCYEIAKKYDFTWDIFIDYENKKFVFTTWQGADKSNIQELIPSVTFSKELDNVLTQEYIQNFLNHKTTAIVAGEGEDVNRVFTTVNDELFGWDRKEIFIEANDLRSKYEDENGNEIILNSAQYINVLKERGTTKLSENQVLRTFETAIDPKSQYIYGDHYDVGDKVSIENYELGIVMHPRIVKAIEVYNKRGQSLTLAFGSNIPDLMSSIKRLVKK